MIDEPILDFEPMNERFARAMLAAGYEITSPSTLPGTRNPITGYQRD